MDWFLEKNAKMNWCLEYEKINNNQSYLKKSYWLGWYQQILKKDAAQANWK